ncbi:MAG: hypothetical protein AABY83_05340 [Pseudomonadota bacterium]
MRQLALPIAFILTILLTGCGKAATDDTHESVNITSDAYWIAYRDGQQGGWTVLANGYSQGKMEVRSFSFRVTASDRKYAVVLVCDSGDTKLFPHEVEIYYTHVADIRAIARRCNQPEARQLSLLTGIVKVDQYGPRLGEQRVIFAGPWGQLEDFRAFSQLVPQQRKFDLLTVLMNIDGAGNLTPERFAFLRDYSVNSDLYSIAVDFADTRYAFPATLSSPKQIYTNADIDIASGETLYTGVDFVSSNGQSLNLLRASRVESTLNGASGISYIGIPDRPASPDNPVTQLPREGHRAYAYVTDARTIDGVHPVVRRVVSMFREPRDAILEVPRAPDPSLTIFSLKRDNASLNPVQVSWTTANDAHFGQPGIWYFQIKETAQDQATAVNFIRSFWRVTASRGWFNGQNADAITDFILAPAGELRALPGWSAEWEADANNPLATASRVEFARADHMQAVANALLHEVITDGVTFGEIRHYQDLP